MKKKSVNSLLLYYI